MRNPMVNGKTETAPRHMAKLACAGFALMLVGTAAPAAPLDYAGQLQRLFDPSEQQLARERQGQVFIYNGLTDEDVERAMNQAFDRIESMMFVNVVDSRTRGPSPRVAQVGRIDDGC